MFCMEPAKFTNSMHTRAICARSMARARGSIELNSCKKASGQGGVSLELLHPAFR